MNNEMIYESCLYDNYDNGYCCMVNSNRYSAEHEMTSQQKPESKFDRPADESKEFGKKF